MKRCSIANSQRNHLLVELFKAALIVSVILSAMTGKNPNEQTLQTYKEKLQEYIDNTPKVINDAEYPWIDQALSYIPKDGTILELGSGAGRNAEHIVERHYNLECTEAVAEFVEIMQNNGLNARLLNILTDDIKEKYDMVLANAVLVHFTEQQCELVFQKAYDALNAHGIFAVSVKIGEGEKWTNEKLEAPRYFKYWQPDAIKDLAEKFGFEWLSMSSGEVSLKNASWLYIILRKRI